jgi:hypothetical protein
VEGVGAKTVPQYSDLPLGTSIPEQITAAGGTIVSDPSQADIVLAINTPADGITRDSTDMSNQYFASPSNKRYIANLGRLLDQGANISLADVAFSNGGDNGFLNELSLRGYTERLSAYNGWNTADNAIGFAISQGMLAATTPKEKQLELLRERILDDWYYQSNARRIISSELEEDHQEAIKYNLGTHRAELQKVAQKEMERLTNNYTVTVGTTFTVNFPWDRLFEVSIENLKTTRDLRSLARLRVLPDVPVFKE